MIAYTKVAEVQTYVLVASSQLLLEMVKYVAEFVSQAG
jgi:hypothetical protein